MRVTDIAKPEAKGPDAMKTKILWLLACAAIPNVAAAEPARDLYRGVTLIDPVAQTATPDSYILVDKGRIVATGKGKPRNAKSVRQHDFTGLYAMPGLIDTHAHVTLGTVSIKMEDGKPRIRNNPTDAITTHNARTLLAFGVTTIRNPGGDVADSQAYVAQRKSGALLGPEMIYAGGIIDAAPITIERLATPVTPGRSIGTMVAEQAKGGARYVKLYTSLSEAHLGEGIAAAHAQGMKAIAHLGDVSWTRAAELGIDGLVHMMPISPALLPAAKREAYLKTRRVGAFEFFEWYEAADLDSPEAKAMIATLARRKVTVDATLVAFQPAFFGNDPALLGRDRTLDHPDMVANWHGGFRFDLGWKADDYARAQKVWPKVLDLTRRLYEAGVPLTLGTDQANPFITPGISMSREMALHREAGIPAWAILRMATSDAAKTIGIGARTGKLKRGMEADIVFLDADPVADLANVARVRWVVSDGALHAHADLLPARPETQGDMK